MAKPPTTAEIAIFDVFEIKDWVMVHKICGLVLFFAMPIVVPAQYGQFLNHPDVIWAAEIEITYSLKPPPAADPLWANDIVYWKSYDPKDPVQYEGGELLIRKILQAARSGLWPAWQLHNPEEQLTLTAVADSLGWGYDTIVTFDVITYEESVKIVRNELDPSGFTAIRARQLLYFDNKKGEFGLATIAVAPVFRFTKKVQVKNASEATRDTILYERVPFWLKMPAFSKKIRRKHPDVNHSEILWAAQVKTLGHSPEPDHVMPLKNTKPTVMQALLDRFRYDPRYKATDFYNEPLPFETREALFVSSDTLVRYNPETYAESIEINRNEIRADDTPRLRLVENWYWDDRQQRLIILLDRFAPMVERDFPVWQRPLFWRRCWRPRHDCQAKAGR